MKIIKLFENFSPDNYLWEEFRFWSDKLPPEELFYLSVFSVLYSKEKNSRKVPFFRVENIDVPTYNNIDFEYESEDESSSVEFECAFGVANNSDKDFSLEFTITSSCYFTDYDPGSYYQPPEGGEPVINRIDAKNVIMLDESINNIEINLSDGSYQYVSEFIDKKKLINAIEYLGLSYINYSEDKTDVKVPEIPQGLIDKCEKIRREIPDIIRGYNIMRRFK